MRKEAQTLLDKSTDSLVLAIEKFNCPWDRGRQEVVLILLDRAFELLLKAAILQKGGRIREARARETIGFDKCVRKCLSEKQVQCLTKEQAITIQIVNSLRDAAQHYVVEMSEQQLYLYAQAGVTLYGDILKAVFRKSLHEHLPSRVLPVSSSPPKDLHSVVEAEFRDIRALAAPRARQSLRAKAKLRALAVIEASLAGVRSQPSEGELNSLIVRIRKRKSWRDLFPGVASLSLDTTGTGLSVTIRITKSEGEAVRLVPEGTPGATIVSVKRVNEASYYSLGLQDLATKLGISAPKALALIQHLNLQESDEDFKLLSIGKVSFKRYSQRALADLREALKTVDMDDVWRKHRPRGKRRL